MGTGGKKVETLGGPKFLPRIGIKNLTFPLGMAWEILTFPPKALTCPLSGKLLELNGEKEQIRTPKNGPIPQKN